MPDKLEDLLKHRPGGGPRPSPDGWSFLLYLLPSIWMCGISAVFNSFGVITYWLLGGGTVSATVVVGLKHYYGWTWPGVKPDRIVLAALCFLAALGFSSAVFLLRYGTRTDVIPLLAGCVWFAVHWMSAGLIFLNFLETQAPEYWKHCERVSEDTE